MKQLIRVACIWGVFLPTLLLGHSVHVLMPVYNAAPYLTKSIESVLDQSHIDICLILYDDGSSDESPQIVSRYESSFPDKMCFLECEDNRGISFARRALLEKSFEIDSEAFILWLDSDDQFVDKDFVKVFSNQMVKTGADLCLYNFSVVLEDEKQKENLNGLYQEREGHCRALDEISSSSYQVLNPDQIDTLANVTTLGWTKGYSRITWPQPLECPYEDFVYMAALFNAEKITALPSRYKPIEYLRRSQSTTGRRSKETFIAVTSQFEQFLQEIKPEKRTLHREKIYLFLSRKLTQYETLLRSLVSSEEYPEITEKTLSEYLERASRLLSMI